VFPYRIGRLGPLVNRKYDFCSYLSLCGHNTILQDAGRVWPGKKMAGRMGNKRITAQNLAIVRIDTSLDLIFVRGAIPGVDDAHVLIRDAKKKMTALSSANQAKGLYEKVLPKGVDDLPFPAGTAELARALPPVIEAPAYRRSPFIPQE
jgi:large subunit ribosomal protein L3